MMIDPTTLKNVLLVLTGFLAAFAAALWLSLLIWTHRDIHQRTRDPLARILAVLGCCSLIFTWDYYLYHPKTQSKIRG